MKERDTMWRPRSRSALVAGVVAALCFPTAALLQEATGAVVAEIELPGGTTGVPMTYLFNGKLYAS
jgi:hypothetical protein